MILLCLLSVDLISATTPCNLLAMTALLATTSSASTTTGTKLRQLVLTHRPLPLPPELVDGVILLRHGGMELLHLLVERGHLALVVGRIGAGVAVEGPGQAEGGTTVAFHLGLVALAAAELGAGRPGLLFGQGGPALGFGGIGVGRIALGAEVGAFASKPSFGLDATGGRTSVGLGRLDVAEEVLLFGLRVNGLSCKK